jgi:hypothetical protein
VPAERKAHILEYIHRFLPTAVPYLYIRVVLNLGLNVAVGADIRSGDQSRSLATFLKGLVRWLLAAVSSFQENGAG